MKELNFDLYVLITKDITSETSTEIRSLLSETVSGIRYKIEAVPPHDVEIEKKIAEYTNEYTKNTPIVIVAKGELYPKLFGNYKNDINILVVHPEELENFPAKLKEMLAMVGISLEEAGEEIQLLEEDTSILAEYLSKVKAEEKVEEEQKAEVKPAEVKKVAQQIKKSIAVRKKKKPKKKRQRKARGKFLYIFGGYHIGTPFLYRIETDTPHQTIADIVRNKTYEQVKKMLSRTDDAVWITPLSDYRSWFIIVPSFGHTTPTHINRFLLTQKVYPVHSYYLLGWEPEIPSSVVVADQRYFVGITKWKDIVIDVKFFYSEGVSPSDLTILLTNLLSVWEYAGIPEIIVPTYPEDMQVHTTMQNLYTDIQSVIEENGLTFTARIQDVRELPSPENFPRFRKINKFSAWDVIFDEGYLKHMRSATSVVATSFVLAGLFLGVFTGFHNQSYELSNVLSSLNRQVAYLQQAEKRVNDLKKYNIIAKEQNNVPLYIAQLYGYFGNTLLDFSYDANRNYAVGVFDARVLSIQDIQRILLANGLAQEVYITSIDKTAKTIRVGWKPIIKGGAGR